MICYIKTTKSIENNTINEMDIDLPKILSTYILLFLSVYLIVTHWQHNIACV